MSRLFVASFILLAAIGGLLGSASWNRGGRPQMIVLTERELGLPAAWGMGGRADREALRMRFRWQSRDDPQEARLWLSDLKLRELGFNTGVPAGAPEARWFYGRSLPRVAWVAFEYDGPAWRAIERRRETFAGGERLEGSVPRDREPSRLVPVDAAVDLESLRQRYEGAPVVVMPAILELRYETHQRQGPSVWGTVQRLVSPEVSVPFRLRERLRSLPSPTRDAQAGPGGEPGAPSPPRYEVALGVGRLGALWIQDVTVY